MEVGFFVGTIGGLLGFVLLIPSFLSSAFSLAPLITRTLSYVGSACGALAVAFSLRYVPDLGWSVFVVISLAVVSAHILLLRRVARQSRPASGN